MSLESHLEPDCMAFYRIIATRGREGGRERKRGE
jgi:hypothetical protein